MPLGAGYGLLGFGGTPLGPAPISPDLGLPIWGGAGPMVWDGTKLWVADADGVGSQTIPPPYSTSRIDPRTRYLRVIDTTTVPTRPSLVGSIDLSQFGSVSNVMGLRLSDNGLYIYACVRANTDGIYPTGTQGRVLIIDKATLAVVGNARTTGGAIGDGNHANGPRDCVEVSGSLYVTNSNGSTHNVIERFSIATCLSNGTTPTSSNLTIQCPDHAEELAYDGTHIWTCGWNFTTKIQRLDPVTNTISGCSDSLFRFVYGLTWLFGQLWGMSSAANLLRYDRSLFVAAGTVNMVAESVILTGAASWAPKNGMASDGTYLWVAAQGASAGVSKIWKMNPTPASVAIVTTVNMQYPGAVTGNFTGAVKLAYDGTAIWGAKRQRGSPANQPSTIARIIVTPGLEAQHFQWSGPRRALWVADKVNPVLTKIDTTDPSNPTVLAQLSFSSFGSGARKVRAQVSTSTSESNTNLVYVAPFPLSGQPGAANDITHFLIYDSSRNALVGRGSVSVGADTLRPNDFAFGLDGSGNPDGHVYVLAQKTSTGVCKVYKYLWKNILAAYPSVYATPVTTFAPGVHIEQITFGAGFLWGSAGQNGPTNRVYRIDPSSGAMTTYIHSGSIHGCLFAFGSLWASTQSNTILRFNPATWPAAPTSIVVGSLSSSNTCDLVADATTIWVSNGSNFVSAIPTVYRVSTGLATEAVIAAVSIPGNSSSTQGLAFDGQSIWSTLRYGSTAHKGVASYSNGIGTEALLAFFNPSTPFTALTDPVSGTVN